MKKAIYFILLLFAVAIYAANTIPTIYVAPPKMTHTLSGAQKSLLTQAQFSRTGVTTLSQALQTLGGLQLYDMVGNNSQVLISMRGFGANASSNTLLLLNDIPMTNPDLAPSNLNALPLTAIQQIEIIPGSESVLYGDQAVGGVINIVTENDRREKFNFTCVTGSYNQYQCSFSANHHVKQVITNTTLSKSYSANYRQHNHLQQNQLTGHVIYLNNASKVNLDYNLNNESMQFPGALSADQVRENRRQAQNTTNFFSDWNGFLHVTYLQPLASIYQMQLDYARSEMHGSGVLTSPFNQDRITNFLKPQFKATFNTLLLLSGIDLENDSYALTSNFGVTKDRQRKYNLYTFIKLLLNSQTALSFGMRGACQDSRLISYQATNNSNHAWVTTLGLRYQVAQNMNFYARRAGNFRFPKADENAATPPGVNGLKTQQGFSYETGLEITHASYVTKINLYRLALRNEIAFDPTQTPEAPFGTNQNLAPTVRQGVTVSGTLLLRNGLTWNGQVNVVKAHFQSGPFAGKRIPLVSECLFQTGLNYTFKEYWNLYSDVLFTGNQFADNDNGNVAGRLGGYTIFNFNIGYTHKNFSATLRLNNVFNKYYYLYTVYQTNQNSESFYPAPGRNLNLTMTYNFL